MEDGATLISEERKRQIEVEGWTPKHDDKVAGDLCVAASCYALDVASRITRWHESWRYRFEQQAKQMWPWDGEWWKPTPNDPIRQLVKAGALIAAEIDRLQRLNKDNR